MRGERKPLILSKTPITSRPISIAKNATTTIRIFMANLINFQTTTTTRISPINNAQRGTTMPKSSIYLTKYKTSIYHLNIVNV